MWQIPVFARVGVAHIIFPFLQKKIVDQPGKTVKLFIQFGLAFALALALAWAMGMLCWDQVFLLIVPVGFVNGIACYCSWRAVAISQTKNSLFTFWDDIIGMGLSYLILREGRFLNGWLYLGIAMSFTACSLFALWGYLQKKKKLAGTSRQTGTPLKFFGFVLTYSIIWGVATFLMRYWSFNGVSPVRFLLGWYGGACAAAFLIWLCYKEPSDEGITRLSEIKWSQRLLVIVATLCIFAAMGLAYLAYGSAPQTVVQPIFLVSEMIFPALIGLYGFGERKDFSRSEWLFLVLGFAGSLVIVVNY